MQVHANANANSMNALQQMSRMAQAHGSKASEEAMESPAQEAMESERAAQASAQQTAAALSAGQVMGRGNQVDTRA